MLCVPPVESQHHRGLPESSATRAQAWELSQFLHASASRSLVLLGLDGPDGDPALQSSRESS